MENGSVSSKESKVGLVTGWSTLPRDTVTKLSSPTCGDKPPNNTHFLTAAPTIRLTTTSCYNKPTMFTIQCPLHYIWLTARRSTHSL